MCTTALLLALSVLGVPSAATAEPDWLRHYASAREQGGAEEKPIAVFIGSGQRGWNQVSREGQLSAEINHILAESYVCLYVDADDDDGKELASAFGMTDGLGLVISNASGRLQAFRHQGDLESVDLAHYLRKYADPEQSVQFTETNEQQRVSRYQTASPPMGYLPFGGSRSC
jgi:hypothetical protein